MKKTIFRLALSITLLISVLLAGQALAEESPDLSKLPVKGTVTMIDLGADKCIPCKLMAPILEEVSQEFKGRAAIVFLDVWKNPKAAKHFGIRVIPTQIFYDAKGKEIARHEGFLGKEDMVSMLEKCGVKGGKS